MGRRVCVALSVVVSFATGALAQEVAPTSGSDVTADEASPLPPIVVQSPTESLTKSRRRPRIVAAGASSQQTTNDIETAPGVELAGDQANGDSTNTPVGVFTLGQLDLIGGSTITNEAMRTFNKNSLDQAVNLLPGVSMTNTGGSRNERDILVRGFDRLRVPLSIDGVRIYLPADNRLDFDRFLTPDLAEVQVQKGYVSVLNGPGGLGGAINLVSRKPQKEFEAEARTGAVLSGDAGNLNSWNAYAYTGTRKDQYYAQISGTIVDKNTFNLSNDFDVTSPINEDGDTRDHANYKDWRINLKAGYTPNATDEYSINYTTQHGEKSAPLHVRGQFVQGPRYWEWPDWDVDTLSFLSKTKLGDASYVKTNAYYNTFYNVLSAYDDATYTRQTRSAPGFRSTFDSTYDDQAYGGFVEFGTNLIPMNTFKAVSHYRRDVHTEFDLLQPDRVAPPPVLEPKQTNLEDTWSFAVENTFHATNRLDIVAGASYDILEVYRAESVNSATNVLFERPTPDFDAWNYQGAVIYSYSEDGKIHASVSDRARFATSFERFSTRFGLATPNPDLAPERSINYEIGIADTVFRTARVSGSVFYSELQDSIQPVFTSSRTGTGGLQFSVQNQNIDGDYYGFELSGDWDIVPGLRIGANYTYLQRDLNYEAFTPSARPEGTPEHEAFIYLAWDATDKLRLTPSLELAGDRNSLITGAGSSLLSPAPVPIGFAGKPNYVRTGSYALVNMQAEYKFTDTVTGSIGGTNLLDQNYELAEGFPEPGRQFFINMRARY